MVKHGKQLYYLALLSADALLIDYGKCEEIRCILEKRGCKDFPKNLRRYSMSQGQSMVAYLPRCSYAALLVGHLNFSKESAFSILDKFLDTYFSYKKTPRFLEGKLKESEILSKVRKEMKAAMSASRGELTPTALLMTYPNAPKAFLVNVVDEEELQRELRRQREVRLASRKAKPKSASLLEELDMVTQMILEGMEEKKGRGQEKEGEGESVGVHIELESEGEESSKGEGIAYSHSPLLSPVTNGEEVVKPIGEKEKVTNSISTKVSRTVPKDSKGDAASTKTARKFRSEKSLLVDNMRSKSELQFPKPVSPALTRSLFGSHVPWFSDSLWPLRRTVSVDKRPRRSASLQFQRGASEAGGAGGTGTSQVEEKGLLGGAAIWRKGGSARPVRTARKTKSMNLGKSGALISSMGIVQGDKLSSVGEDLDHLSLKMNFSPNSSRVMPDEALESERERKKKGRERQGKGDAEKVSFEKEGRREKGKNEQEMHKKKEAKAMGSTRERESAHEAEPGDELAEIVNNIQRILKSPQLSPSHFVQLKLQEIRKPVFDGSHVGPTASLNTWQVNDSSPSEMSEGAANGLVSPVEGDGPFDWDTAADNVDSAVVSAGVGLELAFASVEAQYHDAAAHEEPQPPTHKTSEAPPRGFSPRASTKLRSSGSRQVYSSKFAGAVNHEESHKIPDEEAAARDLSFEFLPNARFERELSAEFGVAFARGSWEERQVEPLREREETKRGDAIDETEDPRERRLIKSLTFGSANSRRAASTGDSGSASRNSQEEPILPSHKTSEIEEMGKAERKGNERGEGGKERGEVDRDVLLPKGKISGKGRERETTRNSEKACVERAVDEGEKPEVEAGGGEGRIENGRRRRRSSIDGVRLEFVETGTVRPSGFARLISRLGGSFGRKVSSPRSGGREKEKEEGGGRGGMGPSGAPKGDNFVFGASLSVKGIGGAGKDTSSFTSAARRVGGSGVLAPRALFPGDPKQQKDHFAPSQLGHSSSRTKFGHFHPRDKYEIDEGGEEAEGIEGEEGKDEREKQLMVGSDFPVIQLTRRNSDGLTVERGSSGEKELSGGVGWGDETSKQGQGLNVGETVCFSPLSNRVVVKQAQHGVKAGRGDIVGHGHTLLVGGDHNLPPHGPPHRQGSLSPLSERGAAAGRLSPADVSPELQRKSPLKHFTSPLMRAGSGTARSLSKMARSFF